jgi:hypothetical protein
MNEKGAESTDLVERFQNSNHMGSPKGPHFAVASPTLQRIRIMESIV